MKVYSRKYCAGISLACLAFVACEDAQRLSDEASIIFGEFTPHDMAECAGMYRYFELDGAAEIATGATREASRSVYGWTDADAEEQIVGYRRYFALNDRVSEVTSEQCGRMMPLMSRLWERGKIQGN
jgi:hypothetical protein